MDRTIIWGIKILVKEDWQIKGDTFESVLALNIFRTIENVRCEKIIKISDHGINTYKSSYDLK